VISALSARDYTGANLAATGNDRPRTAAYIKAAPTEMAS